MNFISCIWIRIIFGIEISPYSNFNFNLRENSEILIIMTVNKDWILDRNCCAYFNDPSPLSWLPGYFLLQCFFTFFKLFPQIIEGKICKIDWYWNGWMVKMITKQLNLANLHLIIQLLVSLDALELELDWYASQQNWILAKNKHGNFSVFIKTNDDLVNVSYLQMALYGHLVKYSDHNFIAICIKHPKNWKLEIGSIK